MEPPREEIQPPTQTISKQHEVQKGCPEEVDPLTHTRTHMLTAPDPFTVPCLCRCTDGSHPLPSRFWGKLSTQRAGNSSHCLAQLVLPHTSRFTWKKKVTRMVHPPACFKTVTRIPAFTIIADVTQPNPMRNEFWQRGQGACWGRKKKLDSCF